MTAISRTDRHRRGVKESLCILRPCKIVNTTTSCVDCYRTKTKRKITNFKPLGTPKDTTSIKDRNELQKKGSKGLATTAQLYTGK